MVSKLFYFVAILSTSHIALADASFQNELEKFSTGGIQRVAPVTQPEDTLQLNEIADINVNEEAEESLRGSRSNLPRALFRHPLLMVTQPFVFVRDDEEGGGEEEGAEGGGDQGESDDTVADEEFDKEAFVEGVSFPEFFDTANLFTELSFTSSQPGANLFWYN